MCQPEVLELIKDDDTVFEQEPLNNISKGGELVAFKHNSFWQCMDSLRDKNTLVKMWENNQAPWKIW